MTVDEFEALLDYFYHRYGRWFSPSSHPNTRCSGSEIRSPQEYWTLLLSICTRYDLDEVRGQAIQEISSLVPPVDPIRLVELALHHDVGRWLEGAYVSLCTRTQPLTPPEATRVGPAVARKIGRCRAELIMANHDTPINRTPFQNKELVRKVVRQVFWPYGPST